VRSRAMIFLGERHLRHVVKEFMAHYQTERFHHGIDGQLIGGQAGCANDNGTNGAILRRSRPDGLRNFYCRKAT
jgi:hypothetical protein